MTYSTLSYDTALSEAETKAVKATKPSGKVTRHTSDRYNDDMKDLYRRGYTLVGYAKFKSPLVPNIAEWNARQAAKKNGASHVLLAKPTQASMGQYNHLFTYWRPDSLTPQLLGAFYSDAEPSAMAALGCAMNTVEIDLVQPGSPAERAGLQSGDILLAIGSNLISAAGQADRILIENASQPIELKFLRDGEEKAATVQLGPAPDLASESMKPKVNAIGPLVAPIGLEQADRKIAKQKTGVVVTGLNYGGYACGSDLRYGDIILSVDGTRTKKITHFNKSINKANGQVVDVDLLRNGERLAISLDLTDTFRSQVENSRRAQIIEANLAQPAWATEKGGDYTWAAVTMVAVQAGAQAYSAHVEAERQRAIAYAQSRAAHSGTYVVEGRRGGYMAVMPSGESTRISADTAALLQANPSYSLRSGSRRGGNYGIYNQSGDLVQKVNLNSAMIIPTRIDPSVLRMQFDMTAQWNSALMKNDFDSLHTDYAKGAGFEYGGAWNPRQD